MCTTHNIRDHYGQMLAQELQLLGSVQAPYCDRSVEFLRIHALAIVHICDELAKLSAESCQA